VVAALITAEKAAKEPRLVVSLFLLLNQIFDIPIEIKKIDYKTWKAGEELIKEAQRLDA